MASDIIIREHDEANVRVLCDRGIAQELSDYFTFFVPGYQFMPLFRAGAWDGKIRLYNINTGFVYKGLIDHIESFCTSRKYSIEHNIADTNFSLVEAEQWIAEQKLPLVPRDYQVEAFVHAIRKNRTLLLSPTASGKSFIIYMLMRYYLQPTLIVVPTTGLIHQLYTDFEDYGFKSSKYVHKIYSGQDKETDKPVVISTWQSIYKLPKNWFAKFNVVVGDEAHLFKAKSLTTIMDKMVGCKYRFGCTGTLDDSQTHKLVLEGLFGKVHKVTTTKELMEQGRVSNFEIKIINLKHDDAARRFCTKFKYQQVLDYLTSHTKRNLFIRNLTLSLKGNTLLLFQFVEKHGKVLHDMIASAAAGNRKVYFIHGSVPGKERNEIRAIVENESDAIIIASYGTTSTGVNIRNIHNIVFALSSKSKIRNLQSIGRSLRTHETKEMATLYDISDDLQWKAKPNFSNKHLFERVKLYDQEQFNYKIYNVEIGGS